MKLYKIKYKWEEVNLILVLLKNWKDKEKDNKREKMILKLLSKRFQYKKSRNNFKVIKIHCQW